MDIQSKIHQIRGCGVMLDFDLASIYGVETRALKQAVRRNIERFPSDFMFELSESEYNSLIDKLRSQIVILDNADLKGRFPKFAPFAFTELGVAMLSSVLRSEKAIQANINIMRGFVAVRQYLLSGSSTTSEIAQLKERVLRLERENETNIAALNDLSVDTGKELDLIFEAIGTLSLRLPQLNKPRPQIGFKQKGEDQTLP